MDRVTGCIYSEDPRVDRPAVYLVSHTISSHYTMNYTLCYSHPLISLALSETLCGSMHLPQSSQHSSNLLSHPLPTHLEPEPIILTNSVRDAVTGVVECWCWALCHQAPPIHHTVRNHTYCVTLWKPVKISPSQLSPYFSIPLLFLYFCIPHQLPPFRFFGGNGEKQIFLPQRPQSAFLSSHPASPGVSPITLEYCLQADSPSVCIQCHFDNTCHIMM